MIIPHMYKAAVDTLENALMKTSGVDSAILGGSGRVTRNSLMWYITMYCALKAFVGLQGDIKNLVFTPVTQFIRRRVQLSVFSHLHMLSHR